MEFGEWLQEQIESRGWHQARLARRSGISAGQIARVLNNTRRPGPEFCRAIAKALELPEGLVFTQAGLLSPEQRKDDPPTLAEWIALFRQSNTDKQKDLLEVARTLSRQK